MKNANEIAAITHNTIQTMVAARKAKAEALCKSFISPQIEKAAEKGDYQIKYYVPADNDIDVVIDTFSNLGFEVKKKGYELTISWLAQYVAIR